jgi:predicted ATPase
VRRSPYPATVRRLVEALLRACPNLCILATSREVLRIAGETAWRVPSLGLLPLLPGWPELSAWPSDPAAARASGAV